MNHKGFSLIEVIAAMAILGMTLVATLTMFSLGNRDTQLRREEVIALNILRGKQEMIGCRNFSDVFDESGVTCAGLPDCVIDITVDFGYGAPLAGLKKVDMTIQWTSAMGGVRTQGMTMLVRNK